MFSIKGKNLYLPALIVFIYFISNMGILTLVSGLYVGYASMQLSTIFLLSSAVYLYHKSIN